MNQYPYPVQTNVGGKHETVDKDSFLSMENDILTTRQLSERGQVDLPNHGSTANQKPEYIGERQHTHYTHQRSVHIRARRPLQTTLQPALLNASTGQQRPRFTPRTYNLKTAVLTASTGLQRPRFTPRTFNSKQPFSQLFNRAPAPKTFNISNKNKPAGPEAAPADDDLRTDHGRNELPSALAVPTTTSHDDPETDNCGNELPNALAIPTTNDDLRIACGGHEISSSITVSTVRLSSTPISQATP
ncbi:uncharacterized protein LOC132947616 [Metopolophium dirhodum]|uniref:uncharacterized protein LOC132947616 n=1 Tax=Metopolophium dirhodum TaxID=44670 RepID=UPI00298F407F|nr:uncharacterized protein LOC132947616 [Metopolophium dirhodum]